MTDPEIEGAVTQVDRNAADVFWYESNNNIDEHQLLLDILARHRMLGRAEGAAQERAEIVDWLRENAPQYSHEQLADAIERGEYKRSE